MTDVVLAKNIIQAGDPGAESKSQPSSTIASAKANLKIAIVHDWCPSFRGGERVLAELCKLFPAADVFTYLIFYRPM